MEEAIAAMEAQLKKWSVKINALVARTQMAGVHPTFGALMYIDELKALHALAQLKLDEFLAEEDTDNTRARAELDDAWKDLVAAFSKPIQ